MESIQEAEVLLKVSHTQAPLSFTQVVKTCLSTPTMLLSFSIFLMTYGLSVNVVNNGESMLISADDNCNTDHLILFSGVAQMVGRVIIFLVAAFHDKRFSVNRTTITPFNPIIWAAIMCLLQFAVYITGATAGIGCTLVWGYVMVASCSYAFSWSLFYAVLNYVCPPALQDTAYRIEVMGIGTVLSPGLGPLLWTFIFGAVYDMHGYTAPDGSTQCVGQACNHLTFVIGSVCAAAAGLGCVLLLKQAHAMHLNSSKSGGQG